MADPHKISIIKQDGQPEQGSFIIREISPTFYNIEESDTPIEITDQHTLLVTTPVKNSIDNHQRKIKVETETYIYRTNSNFYIKFTVSNGELNAEKVF